MEGIQRDNISLISFVAQNIIDAINEDPVLLHAITTPQTLTASFADVGGEMSCFRKRHAAIWLKITANDATNIQLQVLAKHTAADTLECNLPIMTVSSSVINITPEIVEFPVTNGSYLLMVELNKKVSFIQIQAKDISAGAHATIDICDIT
jgi:hypothetical protein